MPPLLELPKGKFIDPVIMEWALSRYEAARRHAPDAARAMELGWFDDLTLRRWIQDGDAEILTQILRGLPTERFSGLLPAIAERWHEWSGPVSAQSTRVIAALDPQRALALFKEEIEYGDLDLDKTYAMVRALPMLPQEGARPLLRHFLDPTLHGEGLFRGHLLTGLLGPTLSLNPEEAPGLITRLIEAAGNDLELDRSLKAVSMDLFGSNAYYRLATLLRDGDSHQSFERLQSLFRSEAPLEAADRILEMEAPWGAARRLLQSSEAGHRALHIASRAIDAMAPAEIESKQDLLACFVVAAVLHSFERGEIDAEALTAGESAELLAADIPSQPHYHSLLRRLAQFDREETSDVLAGALEAARGTYGEIHVARALGELAVGNAIPALIDRLNGDHGDLVCEAATEALTRLGEAGQKALIERWSELDASQRIFGMGVIEEFGGKAAVDFAAAVFDEVFDDDGDAWCMLAQSAPDPRLLELLEPERGKGMRIVDETIYALSVLLDREVTDLDVLRRQVLKERKETQERVRGLASGWHHLPPETLRLRLRCGACGEIRRYDVSQVVVDPEDPDAEILLAQDLRCTACGEWADFEVLAEGRSVVTVEIIRMAAASKSGMTEEGPVCFLDVALHGREMHVAEALEVVWSALREDPSSVKDRLRLAGIYYFALNRPRGALEVLEPTSNVEPAALDLSWLKAQVLRDMDRGEEALELLETTLGRRGNWRLLDPAHMRPAVVGRSFARLYNELCRELGITDRPLLHDSFLELKKKVGRNDPCPCGSGKKFKKCCWGK